MIAAIRIRDVVSNAVMRSDFMAAWKGVRGGGLASVVAILALAVGIGASVTAAAVAYGGLLKPLPFPDADRLLSLQKFYLPTNMPSGLALTEFDQWRERLTGVMDVTGYAPETATLRSDGPPREIGVAYVVGNWFEVLGVAPEYGRLIDDNSSLDDALVSRRLADRLSPGDPAAVLGRTLTVGTHARRIAGVLPAAMSVVADADVWSLARRAQPLTASGASDTHFYIVMARLRPGRTLTAARDAGAAAIADLVPAPQKGNWQLNVRVLRDALLGDARPVVVVFLAASVLVLFVACANVAMLLVNRAVARSREFAVRIALGASRARLVTVATLETAMLAGAGAAGGWAIARLATNVLSRQTGLALPAITTAGGGAVTMSAVAAAILVVALCGAAPLVVLRRAGMATSLRATTTTGSRGSRRLRGALVVSQLAMTVVLLAGAGLLGRTLLAVSAADIGLNAPQHVVTMTIPIRESTADAASQLALVQRILDETRRQPGVTAAGFGSALPPSSAGLVFTIRVTNDADVDATRAFDMVAVTDGYFEALGGRLVNGRLFTPDDMLSPEPICVMSESALKHLALVSNTAVGRTLNMSMPTGDGPRAKPRVIGVVRDVRYSGLDADAHGAVYVLWKTRPRPSGYLVARTAGDPATLATAMMRIVRDADPSIPLEAAARLTTVIDRTLAPRAARFGLVGVFAIGAALLGVVGLSGALIRSVVERERELAIRSAVGATPRRLLADVFRHGALLIVLGVGIGLGAAAIFARAAAAMLYGVTPRDPSTYALTAIAVIAVALAACYLPARRAAASDPIVLLRSE
jgi:predicted permease